MNIDWDYAPSYALIGQPSLVISVQSPVFFCMDGINLTDSLVRVQ